MSEPLTLTGAQVDDLVAFVRAALGVANYGMKQTLMNANSPPGRPAIVVSGEVFKRTAQKALPHLGLSIKWADEKPKKGRGGRHG